MIKLLESPSAEDAAVLLAALPDSLYTAYALFPLLDTHSLDGVWIQTDGENRPVAVLTKPQDGFWRMAAAENADFEELCAFIGGFSGKMHMQASPAVFEQLHITPLIQSSVMLLTAAPAPTKKTAYVYDGFRPIYDLNLCNLTAVTDKLSADEADTLYNMWLSRTARGVFNGFTRVTAAYTEDGDLASTAFADILGDFAYLREVACAPEYRRQGYASSCVRALCADLQKDGIPHIFLCCEAKNEEFYQKSGFRKYGDLVCGTYFGEYNEYIFSHFRQSDASRRTGDENS